ncbi:MAG TPA: CAP domain-containing protein [Solirubrobacteraceae bacterium]|nr:CAP domain-containing protein [Solirubrobacteraceae bacterium]
MHRRAASLLLALVLLTALSLGGAAGAVANARTRSTTRVGLHAGSHPHAHAHAHCVAIRRAVARGRLPHRSLEACLTRKHPTRKHKARSHGVRLLLHGDGPPGRGPRAGIHPPGHASARVENSEATIAAVLATPCTNTEVTPEPANLQAVRQAVLCLVNQERATHGEQPLRANAELQAAAESHSRECVELDYFAHVSPSGETPVERIEATGYVPSPFDGYVLGENLAWGTYELGTPKAIVAAWIASPPHLANILEARYTETGVGVTPAVPVSRGEGAPGATYGQEFGVLIT